MQINHYLVVKEHSRFLNRDVDYRLYNQQSNTELFFFCTLLLVIFSLSLVEITGIEPVTSWLQTRRSPS